MAPTREVRRARAGVTLPGMAHGNGLTFVTWLMRVGFFAGPPLIGLVADGVGIRWALIVIPFAALVALLLTPCLTPPAAGSAQDPAGRLPTEPPVTL